MPETIQQRRARIDAQIGGTPTIAARTAAREAQTAANRAATRAATDREWRTLARRRDPDWWMYKPLHAIYGGPIEPPKAKPKTYSL